MNNIFLITENGLSAFTQNAFVFWSTSRALTLPNVVMGSFYGVYNEDTSWKYYTLPRDFFHDLWGM